MIVLVLFSLFLPSGLPYRRVQPSEGMESVSTYEITITAALSILPAPLRTFLQANETEFHDLVVADVEAEIRGQEPKSDRRWHFVELDLEAPVVDVSPRRAAVGGFPRDKEQAKALFEKHGSPRGGVLPWIIEERYDNLRGALRAGDKEATLRAAAELLHFSADAAIPTQTSGCCFSIEACRQESPGAIVLRRLYHQTCTAFQEVLTYEVRVHPDRLAPSTKPLHDAFDTATRAYALLDNLLGKTLDGHSELIAESAAAATDQADPFRWTGFELSTLPVVRMQIESGAILAADLITGAWQEAGAPDLKFTPKPQSPTANNAPAPVIPSATVDGANAAFVGSKDSTVYHRPGCAHVARMKLENRVSFADAKAAEAAKRTPCKACKPDAVAPPPPPNP